MELDGVREEEELHYHHLSGERRNGTVTRCGLMGQSNGDWTEETRNRNDEVGEAGELIRRRGFEGLLGGNGIHISHTRL